ncbi:MAG: 30S ribosomal protein S6 [Candidatus Omnitrophica bacterium]|nr:30S ribosomal protein S6 [Candidatus Omnitrophota bacterium]
MQKYEGMLIVRPRLSEEDREKITKKIEQLITQEGGKVKNFQLWGERKLAQEIKKEKRGLYYLFHFSAEPQTIDKIRKGCRLEENILRLLIVKM